MDDQDAPAGGATPAQTDAPPPDEVHGGLGTGGGQGTPSYVHAALDLFAGYGTAEAIVGEGRRLSYRDVRSGVTTVAAALAENGVPAGSAVAVLVGNPPEAIILQLALHLLGCRSVWIAPNAPLRYRMDFLRLAEVDAFVYDARSLPKMGRNLAGMHPGLPVLCLGPHGAGPDLLAAPVVEDLPAEAARVTTEPQSLFQTGGTTGQPKLVRHGHHFFHVLTALSAHWAATQQLRLRHLAVTGFWHVSGQVPAYMTLLTGGTLFVDYGFNADQMLETIERERINSTFVTPPLLYAILDSPRIDRTDTSSLAMLSCGGSAAAPSRLEQAIKRFGPVLRPVYGMSEAPFITALPGLGGDSSRPERLSSCGYAYGDMRIEVRDPANTVLPAGQVGEVWVTGGLMMSEYWGQPELSRETLVDGWVRTGDVGYLDSDGYLFLVDRVKDIIITGIGSTNVYSRPVEDVLAAHPQVRAAAVVAGPHELTGEAVYAYVVPAPGATVTADELRQRVVSELNEVWAPQRVIFVDGLPLTEVGKVDKRVLRSWHEPADRDTGVRPVPG